MNQSAKVEASCASAQMERFFHAAVEMFLVADRRGHLLQVNPAWQRTLGHDASALLGKAWRDHLQKDDLDVVAAALRALGRGESVGVFTTRFRAAAGDWRWLEWTPAPPTGAGEIFATVRDVTAALADRACLAELEDCSGIGRWEIDPLRGAVVWSAMVHAIFDTDPNSHVPSRSDMIARFSAEAQARIAPAMDRVLADGTGFRMDLPLILRDGRRRRVRIGAAADMRAGAPARVFGTIEDVTREHDAWHETYRLGNVALRTTNLLVVATDADRRITWVNPAFEQFTGYSAAEVMGRSPGVLLQSDATDPETIVRLRAALEAGRPVRVEIQNRAKSGVHYWLDIDIQPLRDARGVLTGFISIQSDITDRKALEGALRAERNKLRATLQAMPDLVMEMNADGYFTGFHSSGVTEVPIPPDLFLGRRPEDAFPAAVAEVFRTAVAETRRAGRADGHEIHIETADGGRWYELSTSRRPAEMSGAAPGYVIVLHDITRRVRQQAAIERTTELFKGLFEHSPIAISLTDLKTGAFLDVNRAYQDVTGFSRDELLATDASSPGLRQNRGEEREAGVQQLLDEGRYGPAEMRCWRRDGSPYTAQVRALLLDDAAGNRRVWTFIDDISARRRQEEERERLTREASEARRRLEDALSVLPDAFVYYDADDRLVMCNERYREFYPLSAEAMVPGAKFEDILRTSLKRGQHLPAIGREEEWLAERLASRDAEVSDMEQRLFDGRWLRVIERRTPEGGRVGMRIDVTALKQAEARLASIIEGARVGVWEWSSVADASQSNAQWAHMLGYDPKETAALSSERWRAIVHPEDLPRIDAVMKPVRARTVDRVEYEYRMRHRAGHWVWVLTRARATWHADGSLTVAGVNVDITERKALESDLLAERNRLRATLEAIPDLLIEVDADGRYTEIFFHPHHPLAIPSEEYVDRLIEEKTPPEVASQVRAAMAEVDAEGRAEVRRYMRIVDGRPRWIEFSCASRPGREPGARPGYLFLLRDITERVLAQQEVAKLGQIAELMTNLVAVLDHDGRVEWVNPAFEVQTGFRLDELRGQPLAAAVFSPDGDPRTDAALRAAMAEGAPYRGEVLNRTRDGRDYWIDFNAQPRRDAAGRLIGYVSVQTVITERKMLEAALEAERDYLARLMETSISGITAVDAQGRVIYANREAEEILGLECDDASGAAYAIPEWRIETLDGAPIDATNLPASSVLITGAVVRDFRHAIVWPDGRRRALSINAAPIDQPGLGARVVCSITDITERLETEASLREAAERAKVASRTKSQFLANMSHEIRTPLNGVLGMAEILHDVVSDPDQREMIETIRESGETLLGVLNDILDLSKIEAGKLTLESTLFRPTDLIAKIETMHSLMAREKGLDLRVYTNPAAGHRRLGDPHRLMQVLHNLVGNAVKFTDSGSVRLILRATPGGRLLIEVTDTGIGMSVEQVQRVFEDFEQADGSMTRRYGGTGLGMSIVRRLVAMMGGTIRVESQPGQGTTVSVDLPLPEADDPPSVTLVRDVAEVKLDRLRILAAEDSSANRKILKTFLANAGADVTLVEHGAAALDVWAAERFDLVLLDISMPVMDGLAALAALRNRAAADGTALPPVIAITANAMTHQIEDYRTAGFSAHVAKPFSRRDLLEAISRVLEKT